MTHKRVNRFLDNKDGLHPVDRAAADIVEGRKKLSLRALKRRSKKLPRPLRP